MPSVLAALLVVAGCDATVPGTPAAVPGAAPTAGAGADPAVWVDRVCGSVLSFATPATAAPDFAPATDLPTVQRTYSGYLGDVVTGVRAGRSALDGVGPSPVDRGDALVEGMRATMTRLEQDFTGAKATVDAADPDDPRGFVASVGQVESTLAAIDVPDVLGEVAEVPELAAAAERAPQCQQVRRLAAAAPR